MAKYTSDTNLIRGAAAVGQSMLPTDLSGLDKVTQAGVGMMDEAVKGYEAEQKKLEEEAKAAKAKQDAIEKSWNDSADQVLLNAGTLGDTLYSSTSDEMRQLKKLYLEGVNEKDDKKRLEAMRGLQSHSTWIQDHKQMNQDYAKALKDGELSNWYKSEAGSEEAHTVDQIMGQKFTKTSRGEDGDIIFHIKDSNGKEKLVPSKEYNNMIMPKNFTITANTEKLQANVNKSEILDEDIVRQSINNSLPNSERDFVAAMHDDVSGKNLKTMLDTSKTLDQEILGSIDPKAWDADTDGVLDPEEKANFIDAVTNPENDFFDLETSKQIMADQIFNGVTNRHAKHWQKKNDKNKDKTRGLTLSYGFKTWGQMQNQYDQISAGQDIIKGLDGTIWNKQENGTYKLSGGEDIRTPNQLKDHFELGHLDSFTEPQGGYTTRDNVEKQKAAEEEAKNKIPLPSDDITSEEFLTNNQQGITDQLKSIYQDYGDFKFEYSDRDVLRIVAPDGTIEAVEMNRRGSSNNKESQNKIRDFIYEKSKEKANTEENNEFAQ